LEGGRLCRAYCPQRCRRGIAGVGVELAQARILPAYELGR
jgi:hypothetical protein